MKGNPIEAKREPKEADDSEVRAEARAFILAAADRGWDPVDILEELACFFDGDPLDLF